MKPILPNCPDGCPSHLFYARTSIGPWRCADCHTIPPGTKGLKWIFIHDSQHHRGDSLESTLAHGNDEIRRDRDGEDSYSEMTLANGRTCLFHERHRDTALAYAREVAERHQKTQISERPSESITGACTRCQRTQFSETPVQNGDWIRVDCDHCNLTQEIKPWI